jgi:hypothetical protein
MIMEKTTTALITRSDSNGTNHFFAFGVHLKERGSAFNAKTMNIIQTKHLLWSVEDFFFLPVTNNLQALIKGV